MKSTEVCVDASLAIKVVVPEAGSDKADALFNQWASNETQLIAPVFFEVETDSILRQKVSLRQELTVEQAQRAFASLQGYQSRLHTLRSKENVHGKSLASFNSQPFTTPRIWR